MRAATLTPGYGMLPCVEPRARANAATAVKKIAVACAVPFVTLAFVLAAPFAGLAMLAWFAARTAAARAAARFASNLLLFAAAPFIALGYLLAAPFVGLAMLAWVAVRREPAAA